MKLRVAEEDCLRNRAVNAWAFVALLNLLLLLRMSDFTGLKYQLINRMKIIEEVIALAGSLDCIFIVVDLH